MLIAGHEFPDDLHVLVEHQTWVRPAGDGTATVGITAMGIHQAGEIYMCRPKSPGSMLQQGRSAAVVELAKSIVAVKSPVRGEVVEANALLAAQPELVHRDPYGAGWLLRVRLADWSADQALLAHGEALAAAVQHYAWLNQIS